MATVAVIGDEGAGRTTLAGSLGKKGTDSDLTFFNFSKGDAVLTYVDPKRYPESARSLVQTLNMADVVLVCVPASGPTARTGECLVACDLLGKRRGLFVITRADESYPQALDELGIKLRAIAANTVAASWEVLCVSATTFAGMEELRTRIETLAARATAENGERSEEPTRVVVDHFFTVTGVGCVVLGLVDRGTVAKRQALTVQPPGFGVEIRSVQCNDVDVAQAVSGARVGLALKGGRAKDFERGFLLSAGEELGERFELSARLTSFTPGLAVGDTVHLFVGLQSNPATVDQLLVDGSEAEKASPGAEYTVILKTENTLAYRPDDRFLIAQLNDPKQRFIAGCAIERS